MSERLNKRQADSARKLIRVQRIIQEFDKHFMGEREMSNTQVRAGDILLNKSIPNLQASAEANEQGELCPVSWDK